MRRLHVAAEVVDGAAGRGAQKINYQLPVLLHAVLTFPRPVPADLRIGGQPGQQIVNKSGYGVITTEAVIQRFLRVQHISPFTGRACPLSSTLPHSVKYY